MKKETFSVFFACAMGALIGAFASLELATHFAYGKYFWALGALLGGFTAYGIVDFAEFRAGVVRAYRETINFGPDWESWKTFTVLSMGIAMACFSIFTPVVILRWVSVGPVSFEECIPLLMCGLPLWGFALQVSLQHRMELGIELLKHTNPISAVFWTAFGIFYGIRYILRYVPAAIVVTMRFVKRAFIYVHSDRRTICFVDAALGAAAGYFYGSAILGAMIGGLFGALNYEVVSVRWLKLVSVKS